MGAEASQLLLLLYIDSSIWESIVQESTRYAAYACLYSCKPEPRTKSLTGNLWELAGLVKGLVSHQPVVGMLHCILGYPNPFGLEVVPRCSDKWIVRPLHPFCTSSISTSMNTVSVSKTSNIQVVEIQITLQDGHHLVKLIIIKFIKIYKLLWVWINEDLDNQGSDNQGGCAVLHFTKCFYVLVKVVL